MKRVIELTTETEYGRVDLRATIKTNGKFLARDEVEEVREHLADSLMQSLSNMRFFGTYLNRIRVGQ